jgi:hypothetical protein
VISGIRRDTDDTQDDGAIYASNVRFSVAGEYRRRLGMERVASLGAVCVGSFVNPVTGDFAMLLTPAGAFEAVAL